MTGFQLASLPGGIPLLQYAGDMIFFIQGSAAKAQTLSTMIDIFLDFSSLRLNQAKSTFVGFGLSAEELNGCSQILVTPIGALLLRYLRVPLADRRLWLQDWQPGLAASIREGGNEIGRLAGTPSVTRGPTGCAEGSPGCHTRLLNFDL